MGQLTWADVRRDWAKPPNLVTYARIGLLPVIWWLILMPELLGWLGWCILLVAVLTDKVDGWLAKLHGGRWTTTLGKVLDSAADKVFILAILIAVYFKAADLSVLAAILVIGAREAVVTWVKSQMPVRSAVEAGRASMVLQSAALLWYCFPPAWDLPEVWRSAAMWLAIGASLTSGWVYVAEWRAAVRQA